MLDCNAAFVHTVIQIVSFLGMCTVLQKKDKPCKMQLNEHANVQEKTTIAPECNHTL